MRPKLVIFGLAMMFLIVMLPICFAAEINLQYDANGNLITGDGKFRLYNSLNQLSKIYNGTNSSGLLLEEYIYHPTEERVYIKKVYNNDSSLKETVYYINENYVRIVNSSGSYDFTYVKHEGQLVAQLNPNGHKFYIATDSLGSSSIVLNESGSVLENTTFEPFGTMVDESELRYTYTGQEYDSVLGDYDFDARRYKAEWGLFTSPDSLIGNLYNPQDLNRYSYAFNNPYRYKDTTGLYEEDVHRDLTRYLAEQAGYSPDEANQIAVADQNIDVTENTRPQTWIEYLTGQRGEQTVRWHFQSREEAEKRLKEALQSGDPEAIGRVLHTYQDSFSHEGLTPLEHGLEGHSPDKTYNNPEKANVMAFDTFAYLASTQGLNAQQILNTWKNIESTVDAFNRATSSSDKSSALSGVIGTIGGSKIVYTGGKVVTTWGKYGHGSLTAYCKKGC